MTETISLAVKVSEPKIAPWGVSTDVFRQVGLKLPALLNSRGDLIEVTDGPDNLDQVRQLLVELQNAGVDVTDSITTRPQAFLMSRSRSYSASELAEFEYVIPHVKKVLGEATDDYFLDENEVPHVKAAVKPYKAVIGALLNESGPVILVRRPVKERLERSNVVGLKLVEPKLFGRRQVSEDEKVWAVWSELVLPPMKNILHNSAGERFRWRQRNEYPGGCLLIEGYAFQPEPHYLRTDIAKMEPFDIALTLERFGFSGRPALQPEVVISQKLAGILFDELGTELSGQPVRLDDDDIIPWVGPFPSPWDHLNQRPNWLQQLEK